MFDLQIPNIHEDASNISSNHGSVFGYVNLSQNENEERKIMINLNVHRLTKAMKFQREI